MGRRGGIGGAVSKAAGKGRGKVNRKRKLKGKSFEGGGAGGIAQWLREFQQRTPQRQKMDLPSRPTGGRTDLTPMGGWGGGGSRNYPVSRNMQHSMGGGRRSFF